jgi:polyferredoxin
MRFELTKQRLMQRVLRSRPFLFVVRLPFVFLFVGLIYAAFFGNQFRNLATAGTGVLWLIAVSLLTPLFGKVWCVVCPWDALAEWCQRLAFWRKSKRLLSAEHRWPRLLGTAYPALALFLLLVWAEYAFHFTDDPRLVGYVSVGLLAGAIVFALLFRRKTFCRYVCPVGAISGLYAMFAVIELRVKKLEQCRECATKDCVRGNDHGYGCPVYEYPGKMVSSIQCILCTECLKTCPHDNVGLYVRSPAREIMNVCEGIGKHPLGRSRALSLMVATMLSLSFLHGISLTPFFQSGIEWAVARFYVEQWQAFTLLLVPFVCVSWILCAALGLLFRPRGRESGSTVGQSRGDFLVLPLVLTVHLIFLVRHAFLEGEKVVPLLSDPLGRGWDLFGTAGNVHWAPFEGANLVYIASGLAVLGVILSLVSASVLIRRAWGSAGQRALAFVGASAFSLLVIAAAVWLAAIGLPSVAAATD